jgi:hypothetical protein
VAAGTARVCDDVRMEMVVVCTPWDEINTAEIQFRNLFTLSCAESAPDTAVVARLIITLFLENFPMEG